MNISIPPSTVTTSAATIAQQAPSANKTQLARSTRKVVDIPTRMFHWLFAFCFVGAYVTADGESFRLLHVTLGYTMAGLLGFRLVWGLIGPRHARLGVLARKLSGTFGWLKSFRTLKSLSDIKWQQGQNILMALAVAALLLTVIPITLTGYATYNEWGGKWLQHIHEAVGEFYLFLVIAHLVLIAMLSLLRWKNQAMPMVTGRTSGPGPDLIKKDGKIVGGLLLLGVLSWWIYQFV